MTQICLFDLVDVDTVIADSAVVDVVEPVDQIGNGGFPGASGTDECDLLSRLCIQRNIVQYSLFRCVPEVDVIKADIALQFGICDSAVMMGMFPCPDIGAFVCFADAAIGIFSGVNQCHISFIRFRLFVKERQNTVRTCQAHDDHIDLIGDLPNSTGKLLCHVQKRHDNADAERHTGDADIGNIGEHQCATDQGDHNIHHIADVAE